MDEILIKCPCKFCLPMAEHTPPALPTKKGKTATMLREKSDVPTDHGRDGSLARKLIKYQNSEKKSPKQLTWKKKKNELYCNLFCDLVVVIDNSLCLCLSVCVSVCLSVSLSVCLSVCLSPILYLFFFLSFLLLLCLKLLYVHTHENVFVNQVLNLKISTLFDCNFCTLFVLFSDMFWTVLRYLFIVHNNKLWRTFSLSCCFWCNYL